MTGTQENSIVFLSSEKFASSPELDRLLQIPCDRERDFGHHIHTSTAQTVIQLYTTMHIATLFKKIFFHTKRGFTAAEFLIVIAILALLSIGTVSTFVGFRDSQALSKDTELVVETLRQARSQTLTSQNSSQYGVHIGTTNITLFAGATYTAGSASNQVFPLTSRDTVVTITLTGGGSDVVFKRLSGETSQNGTIVLTSASSSKTKTVTIYKTGLVESN